LRLADINAFNKIDEKMWEEKDKGFESSVEHLLIWRDFVTDKVTQTTNPYYPYP